MREIESAATMIRHRARSPGIDVSAEPAAEYIPKPGGDARAVGKKPRQEGKKER